MADPDVSLRRALTSTTMISVAVALLLSCGAFGVYGLLALRDTMVRTLSAEAAIIARHSASALVFQDPDAAASTLAAFSAEPGVVGAAIYDQQGSLFASYRRPGDGEEVRAPAPTPGPSFVFEARRLVVSHPIAFDGSAIGRVVVVSDLTAMATRLQRYLMIMAGAMAVAFVLAYLTSGRLQRTVTRPVLELAATAQAVSTAQDYGVRAATGAQGELGVLQRTFNHMLDQIQQRDAELQGAREDLERLVGERTAALQREVAERRHLAEELRVRNDELQQQSLRVQETTRLKSEFLANMSHELRTPLNGIIGFAELMHDGRVGPVTETHKECLGDILTSSRHLLQLINDVLDLSKVEAGRMEFRPEPVELPRLVAEVRDVLRTLSARKRIMVDTDFSPDVVNVQIDPGKLKQVLYNFLSNAIKFTPPEGHVTVATRPDGAERFRIEVRDTGPGIAESDLRRLFVEFQQLDAGAAKTHQGTGLGLALTRRIVEAQGGAVGVSSVVGEGSVFHAVLPRHMERAETEVKPATMNVPLQGVPSILVVEDDPGERAWLVHTLRAAGYAVEEAHSAQQARDCVRARAYDGITLDVFLPDGTGWDVLKELRRDGPNQHTPVVAVTVVAEKQSGAAFAIQDYLVKPIGEEQLLSSLRRAGVVSVDERPVLVIDDDPQARRLLDTMLGGLGYRSLTADAAEEGLRLAAQESISAVILDLLMPGVDGFQFLDRFRQTPRGRRTPVIVWTAKDLDAADHARLAASAQAVVLKREGGAGPLMDELRLHAAPRDPGGRA